MNMTLRQNPNCCRFVYRDYSCYLSCLKGHNFTYPKCARGKGKCPHRVYRFTKAQREIESDPCNYCHYRTQACAYILDGKKEEDACMEKKIHLRAIK